MTHEQLVNVAIGGHITVLSVGVIAFFKWGFRSGDFRVWFEDTDKILNNIRRRIAIGLWEKLKPVFDSADSAVSSEILDADGRYFETPVDPKRNEGYQNALFDSLLDFIENNADQMVHYRVLLSTRRAWCSWTRYLSWSILILVIFEVGGLSLIGGVDKLLGRYLPDWIIYCSFLPTALGGLSCFCALPFSLYYHTKGTKYVEQYNF